MFTKVTVRNIDIFGNRLIWSIPDKQIVVSDYLATDSVRQLISIAYGEIFPPSSVMILESRKLVFRPKLFSFGIPKIITFAFDTSACQNYLSRSDRELYSEFSTKYPVGSTRDLLTDEEEIKYYDKAQQLITCPICMTNKIMTKLECGHTYCYPCLYEMFKNNMTSCSLCSEKMLGTVHINMLGEEISKIERCK